MRKAFSALESGWQDSNLRPRRPERRALPGCATPRKQADGAACFQFPIVTAEKSLRTRKFEGFWRAIALQSEWQDSNLRPPAPHAGAIPGYATPRWYWSDKGKPISGFGASQGQIKFFAMAFLVRWEQPLPLTAVTTGTRFA